MFKCFFGCRDFDKERINVDATELTCKKCGSRRYIIFGINVSPEVFLHFSDTLVQRQKDRLKNSEVV